MADLSVVDRPSLLLLLGLSDCKRPALPSAAAAAAAAADPDPDADADADGGWGCSTSATAALASSAAAAAPPSQPWACPHLLQHGCCCCCLLQSVVDDSALGELQLNCEVVRAAGDGLAGTSTKILEGPREAVGNYKKA